MIIQAGLPAVKCARSAPLCADVARIAQSARFRDNESKLRQGMLGVIDEDGFRANVGIIVANDQGQVLWARRAGQDAWQFPQGGINPDESVEEALYRELKEETGLDPDHVEIMGSTRGWLRYRLPKRMLRQNSSPFIGQKQRWYLLKMLAGDEAISFAHSDTPEFDRWCWVSYWYPLGQVVSFKQNVYRKAMKELAPGIARCLTRHA